MRAIFISYRRDDTEGHAGRLFEDLCDRFGKDAVFMDVAGIEPGRDFRRAIEEQVASCGVLLAVIGKNWLAVADAQGRRRLDDPYDFVRLETAGALKRDIPVIPVLVHHAEMPRPEQLPDELKDLAFRNGVELTHARWASDVQVLIKALLPYVDAAPSPAPASPPAPSAPPAASARRLPGWITVPLAAAAAGGVGYVVWDRWSAPTDRPAAASAASASASALAAPTLAPPASTAVALSPAPPPGPSSASSVEAPSSPTASSATAPLPAASDAVPATDPAPRVAQRSADDKPVALEAPKPRRVEKPASTRQAPAPAPATAPAPYARETAPAPAASPPALAAAPAPSPREPAPSSAPAPAPASPPAVVAALPPAPDPVPAPAPRDTDLLGGPGTASMVTRTIAIRPDTKYVNVTGGEVIRFEVGAKSFIWNFSGRRSSFDLARVAPPELLDHKVTAYVAPNPLYPRRN